MSYFQGKKELFRGLKIEHLETQWRQHAVFRLDFNGVNFTVAGELEKVLESYLNRWETEYGLVPDTVNDTFSMRWFRLFERAKEATGHNVVVLVDEYDKPLLDVMEIDEALLSRNRETLKAFYSVFKLADEHLRFVFLTGVTKFAQISVYSGFIQPQDISMVPRYEALCGITEAEIDSYFTSSIQQMADEMGFPVEVIRSKLKHQYDGYHFSHKQLDIYNPFSLFNALKSHILTNYWFASGTPTYLIRLLNQFNTPIDSLTGKYYMRSEFTNYRADVAYPLPMIYQSGYLTIKAYDPEGDLFLLDFPNNEVKGDFWMCWQRII